MRPATWTVLLLGVLLQTIAEAQPCLEGAAHDTDLSALRNALASVDLACPCDAYPPGQRRDYRTCADEALASATTSGGLRRECLRAARKVARAAVCGSSADRPVPCITSSSARMSCKITPTRKCVVRGLGPQPVLKHACSDFGRCLEAADTNDDFVIGLPGDSGTCRPRPCGNGVLEDGEECDDGNRIPFDGCSPDCRVEVDCDPDGVYTLDTPVEYVCEGVHIEHIDVADHGRDVTFLNSPGMPQTPLSCAGSLVDRVNIQFSLFECAFVAHLSATFSDPDTLQGRLEFRLESLLLNGAPCTPFPPLPPECGAASLQFTARR